MRHGIMLLGVLLVLGGCSRSWEMKLDPAVAPLDSTRVAEELEAGSDVRLTLTSGETTSGTLRAITDEGLVLGIPGNFGWNETTHPFETIVQIETSPDKTGLGTAAGNTMAVFTIGMIGLMIAAGNVVKDGGAGCA